MKLRKPCEHVSIEHPEGRYEGHWIDEYATPVVWCPGGVFLPDDTLIIERPEGFTDSEWISTCEYIKGMGLFQVPGRRWGPDHPSYDEMGQ